MCGECLKCARFLVSIRTKPTGWGGLLLLLLALGGGSPSPLARASARRENPAARGVGSAGVGGALKPFNEFRRFSDQTVGTCLLRAFCASWWRTRPSGRPTPPRKLKTLHPVELYGTCNHASTTCAGAICALFSVPCKRVIWQLVGEASKQTVKKEWRRRHSLVQIFSAPLAAIFLLETLLPPLFKCLVFFCIYCFGLKVTSSRDFGFLPLQVTSGISLALARTLLFVFLSLSFLLLLSCLFRVC